MNQFISYLKPAFQIAFVTLTAFAIGCSVGDKKIQNNKPVTEQLGEAAAKTNEGLLTDRGALQEFANMVQISQDEIDDEWRNLRTALPTDPFILGYGAVYSLSYIKLAAFACFRGLVDNRGNARAGLTPNINYGQNAATNLPDDNTRGAVAQTMATAMQGGKPLDNYALGKVVEAMRLAATEVTDVARVVSTACFVIASRGYNTIR